MDIEKILELIELDSLENGYQGYIELWDQYYRGNVDGFHVYEEWRGDKNVKRKRLTLSMAKTICGKWADNSYNPEASITVGDTFQERLDEILKYNDFASRINNDIEKGYALGTLGIETKKINDIPHIMFTYADMMTPIVDGDGTFGWSIVSEYKPNVYYVSVHYEELKGKHRVDNHVIKVENDKYELLSKETIKSEYGILPSELYEEPMLQIFRPATANNLSYNTPYGMSIYANALDELKAVDIAYTLFNSEIEIGKMRYFTQVDNLESIDGNMKFPENTEGFYIMEGTSTFEDGTTVKTSAPALRTEDLNKTLLTNMNLLGKKVGFGDNFYSIENGQVYTNTAQVISTNSEFFKSRQKHLTVLEEVLARMVRSIYLLDTGKTYKEDVTVNFDDSIIHDKEQEDKELDYQLNRGLISEITYWERKEGLTEEQAIEFVAKQKEQQKMFLVEMPDEEGEEE